MVRYFKKEISGRLGALGLAVYPDGLFVIDSCGREIEYNLWRANNTGKA